MGINRKAVVLEHVAAHFVKIVTLNVKKLTAFKALEVVVILARFAACVLVTAHLCII